MKDSKNADANAGDNTGIIGVDEDKSGDKDADSDFSVNGSIGSSTSANICATSTNKNKDKDAGDGVNAGTSITGVYKNEDIDSNSSSTVKGRMSENIRKQLKVSKSKLFVTIINCKKSYLLKKMLAIKLS